MAAAFRLGPILEAGAVVQDRVVVHQLHVARLELHEHVERGSLVRASNMSSASTCAGVSRGAVGKRWAESMYWR
jgi:hypothetical protein